MDHRTIIEFIFGGMFVGFYAYSRFSNTKVDSQLPIGSRYFISLVFYIFLTLVIYFLISLLVTAGITLPFLEISNALEDLRNLFSEQNQVLSAQLLVALLMTEVLPRNKKMRAVDHKLRIFFRRMAALSSVAQSLSAKFQYETLVLDESHEKAIENSFKEWGFEAQDIQTESSKKPQHIWTRISLLWFSLHKWEQDPDYRIFFNNHSKEMKRLDSDFESLSNKAKYCFKLSSAAENDPDMKTALRDCTNHYTDLLKQHLQKLSDFMSRGLLSSQKGDAQSQSIREIGFEANFNRGISLDQLILMFIVLSLIMILGFSYMQWNPTLQNNYPNSSSAEIFIKAIMIASIYSIGILCALMATWRCERTGGSTRHRWATYFSMGLVAAFMGSLVSILMNTILKEWDLNAGFEEFIIRRWPWQFMVFTTTFTMTYLLNRRISADGMALNIRLKEAGIMTGALLLALFIAGALMALPLEFYYRAGFVASAMGFSMGYFLPTWYRGAPKSKFEYPESPMKTSNVGPPESNTVILPSVRLYRP